LVDLVGIEPTTSSMPWKRAPSCATGPREGDNFPILVDAEGFVKPPQGRGHLRELGASLPASSERCSLELSMT
jgi:hypothetical protein